ncbi:MAG: FG-GAP-like repeat-containing protein [Cyclobacteriaceae bacterium]
MKVFLLILSLCPIITLAQVQYTDISSSEGFRSFNPAAVYGSGAAAADYDNDGDIDLYVLSDNNSDNMLYRNLGNGDFDLLESEVSTSMNSRAALWFDYNGDHLLDLIVAGDCDEGSAPCPDHDYLLLFRQAQNGSFENVTLQSGLTSGRELKGILGGIATGDINNDGFLDLLIDYWGENVYLFLNSGNESFQDVSKEMGISNPARYWQPLIFDITGNGWPEIYLTVDGAPNLLWENNANGFFEEVGAEFGLDNNHNDMGACLGDFDNDDDLDIYITNIEYEFEGEHNALFENISSGGQIQFSEVSRATGVSSGGWGWGITFLDANNDMFLDLAATNGPVVTYAINDQAKLWLNNGDKTFTDISNSAYFNSNQDATTLISFDYDRDGDLDMVQTLKENQSPVAMKLFENQLNTTADFGNYLVIKPRMSGTNHWAIGAKISIRTGSEIQSRAIVAGSSFYGQEPAEAFFGLDMITIVDEVIVTWPGGAKSIFSNVASNQVLIVNDMDVIHKPGLLVVDVPGTLKPELKWGHMSTRETEYIIERAESLDFNNFTSFKVEADKLSFTDEDAPELGTFYYRIKASDGVIQSEYSNIASAKIGEIVNGLDFDLGFSLYPNPTSGTFNIKLSKSISELQLLTIGGQIIDKISYFKLPNSEYTYRVKTSVPEGLYFLKVKLDQETFFMKKISIHNR